MDGSVFDLTCSCCDCHLPQVILHPLDSDTSTRQWQTNQLATNLRPYVAWYGLTIHGQRVKVHAYTCAMSGLS